MQIVYSLVINIFKSFLFFASLLFNKRHYDVIFYYPSHFNRGEPAKNSFFDIFYNICDKYNISYLILEEPELFKKNKRNKEAISFDFILILILILRKLISLDNFESFQHREWYIAKLLKPIFFRKLTYTNYIVLSNSMMGFFRGLNKDAKLYDYQHGVITSDHSGYIELDKKTAEHILLNDANVMVYGKGFRDVLVRRVSNGYYDSHTYVMGQGLNAEFQEHYGKKCILFSLQFADPDKLLNQIKLDKINQFFEKYKEFFVLNGITILLKHHPRFQNDINPTSMYDFEFTRLYEGTLTDALEMSFLHLTFNSTTVFEAASIGIPTLLWNNELKFMSPDFFIEDYLYPLGIENEYEIIDSIKIYLSNKEKYEEDSKSIYEWYHCFYQPIDENLFVSLIKGQK